MLHALERGVQGGKWFSLVDKVWKEENLRAAWAKVRANRGAAGVDHETVEGFERRLEENLRRLQEDLRAGRYRPAPVKRVWIPKPGRPGETRPLGIPTVRDRVVQAAVRNVLEPIYEDGFAEQSYGFRPKRSTKDALRVVRRLLDEGYTHVVDADIKGYFDTISHEILLARLRERVTDGKVLALVEGFLKAGVLEDWDYEEPGEGTPQGGVISPLLANIYLNPLDHLVAERGWRMVRYADDFVILCRSAGEAEEALSMVREWTASVALTLHPEKTRIVDLEAGGGYFDFLGYRFRRRRHSVGPKAQSRIRERIRDLTPRKNGYCLQAVITKLNKILVGWYQYFKHGSKTTMLELDAFVRRRLRAILWRRRKKSWSAGPTLNRKYPNAFFDQFRLLSLKATRKLEVAARHAGRPPTGEPCA